MNTKKIMFTSASVSMFCVSILLIQSLFPGWTKASTTSTNDVLQRLEDLEVVQEDNDKSFFLVDTSLNDLDARVLELEKITEAQARQIDALTKRYGRLLEAIR